MRWLVDEGLPKVLVEWLRARDDDVLDVAGSEFRGSCDELLWQVAGRQKRIMITRDLGLVLPDVVPWPPGVVLVRAPDRYRAQSILRLVQDGLSQLTDAALYQCLTVIQPGRVRQRKLHLAGPRRRQTPDSR